MIPKSRILTLEVVNGDHAVNLHVGFPIFLGQRYPKVLSAMGRCGHIIGFGDAPNTVKVYSDGYVNDSRDLIKHLDDASGVQMKLFNNHSLFLMDSETIDELLNLHS